MTGADLDRLDEAEFAAACRDATVFARTSPEDKLRLVEALQAGGLVVAMTGDGVNDAPALKRADIGVAMGGRGTEAAKEASAIVLADDNFASIVAAVREGRTVHDNIRKLIGWTLPTDIGEGMTIVLAIAFGLTLPISAVQILWVNMVTTVALGLTLAFEPTEPGTMSRPPRPPGEPLLTPGLVSRILFVSALVVAGAFGGYAWATARGLSIETARTMVVNALVVMEIFYLFSVRFVHGPCADLAGRARDAGGLDRHRHHGRGADRLHLCAAAAGGVQQRGTGAGRGGGRPGTRPAAARRRRDRQVGRGQRAGGART